MIYKTPRFTYDACVNRDSITIIEGAGELLSFLRSLPDRPFEIVGPGNVQVRWPEGATKENITWHADNQRGRGLIADSLYALAAIAPVEKKEKKMMKVLVTLDFGTHKVGPFESECEVTE